MDERRMTVNKVKLLSVWVIAVVMILTLTAGDAMDTSPAARAYHQMAYDSESGLVVMYGGQTGNFFEDPSQFSHETWVLDPEKYIWTQLFPSASPEGSSGGDMTYNSDANVSILSVITDDWSVLQTWAYDAKLDSWAQLADGPYPMVGQRIVYDLESDRVIMFGGFELTKYKFVDETWAYDYNTDTWTNMQPKDHPKGRNYVGMVYESKADRVVVWGDWNKNYTNGTDKSIWTYDYNTNTWQEFKHKKDGPAIRDYMMLAYDEKADKIIVYGGYEYGNDETWAYDLNNDTWQQMQPAENPGILSRYAMVYANNTERTILFGGQIADQRFIYSPETWFYEFNTGEWVNMTLDD